jgi:hypothetical protein
MSCVNLGPYYVYVTLFPGRQTYDSAAFVDPACATRLFMKELAVSSRCTLPYHTDPYACCCSNGTSILGSELPMMFLT